MKRFLALVVVLGLSGCATTTQYVPLKVTENSCQVTEVKPSGFSTLTIAVCWDQDKKPIGMTGAGGRPVVDVPLAVLGVGGMVGAGALIGNGLGKQQVTVSP